jgi:exonuclease SbcC
MELKVGLEKKEELKKRQREIQFQLEQKNSFKKQLGDGMCPILQEKCLNIEKKGGVAQFFEKPIRELNEQLKNVSEKIEELGALEMKKEKLEKEVKNNEFNIRSLEEKLDEIEKDKASKKQLLKDIETIQNSYSVKDLKTVKKELEDKLDKMHGSISALESTLENTSRRRDEIEEENKEHKQFIDQLRQLIVKEKDKIRKNQTDIESTENELKSLKDVPDELKKIEDTIKAKDEELEKFSDDYKSYMQNIEQAKKLDSNKNSLKKYNEQVNKIKNEIEGIERTIEDRPSLEALDKKLKKKEESLNEIRKAINELNANIGESKSKLSTVDEKFEKKKNMEEKKKQAEEKNRVLNRKLKLTKVFREKVKSMGKYVSQEFTRVISQKATENYRRISGRSEEIKWDSEKDYLVTLKNEDGVRREFSVLSGGEQVSVAISIRTSLANLLSKVNIYILDEPTVNLDDERRNMLAENLKYMFDKIEQAFIVTHDGTFQEMAENVIDLNNMISQAN